MAKFKELEKNKIQVEFVIESEMMDEAKKQAYQKTKGRYAVPGFRKGKAPKNVIEKFYGEGAFFEDALDIAFPMAFEKAVEELELFPVSRPDNIDIVSFEEPLTLSCEVYIKPEVELGEYKGVTVNYTEHEVTEEDVQSRLESIREQNARFETVEREVKDGDKVIIDYSGSVDGVKFDGGTAEEQPLDIGSKTFIPGFEEQIIGMKTGEEKDIEVTFPEDYHAEDLKGKKAIFAIKLKDVKEKQLPELDDEFAQDISEFDTIEEYKNDTLNKLKEQAEKQAEAEKENKMVEKVVANATVDIPACMIDTQVDYQIQEFATSLMYQGVDFETYMKYLGTDIETLKAQVRPTAENKVKSQLVLEAIVKAENIQVEDADLEEFLKPRAEKEGKEVSEIKEGMKGGELEYIKDRVLVDKLLKMLQANTKFELVKEDQTGEEK